MEAQFCDIFHEGVCAESEWIEIILFMVLWQNPYKNNKLAAI